MSDDLLQRLKVHGSVPAHIAIIMDGNGRWAKGRALPRPLGHHAGMRRRARGDPGLPRRRGGRAEPVRLQPGELAAAGGRDRRADEPARGVHRARGGQPRGRSGVSVRILGDLERLAPRRAPGGGPDHGGDRAAATSSRSTSASPTARARRSRARRGSWPRKCAAGRLDPADIDEEAVARRLYTAPWPDPDLLIRTSGEMRISNFLLWQLAYAELYVTPVLWPDFTRRHLFEAILEFQRRDRRFGRVSV